jgi:mono/diheme cytochrome c family protein
LTRPLNLLLAAIGLFVAIQLVPYGRDHTNPRVVREPDWDGPQTRETFMRVCQDCHSNETDWPWYSVVAPSSWLVQHDVDEGRSHFNVSEWGGNQDHDHDPAKMVREGEMPPWFYLPLHSEAWLGDAEREAFVAGLQATFGAGTEGGHGADSHH